VQQVAYAEFRFILVLRERRQKAETYFFGLFYKSTKISFYCECTQISDYHVISPAPHTFTLSTFTMQPVHYHYFRKICQTYEKKHCSV